jgi:hypothetical protein
MTFDLDTNAASDNLFFFHMTLPTVEGVDSDSLTSIT